MTDIPGCILSGRTSANLPTAYYGSLSGVGLLLNLRRSQGDLLVAAIGLGAGTVATYGVPGQSYRFYEINPQIERLADEHFSFLEDCSGRWLVALGDSPLISEREPPKAF